MKKFALLICTIALLRGGAVYGQSEDNMHCNEMVLSKSIYFELEKKTSDFVGKTAEEVKNGFQRVGHFSFGFERQLSGTSGRKYDLYSASQDGLQIFAAFERDGEQVKNTHIRAYFMSGAHVNVADALGPECFLEEKDYADFIHRKFPAGDADADNFLEFAKATGLVLHRETPDEVVLFQGPFPLASFEADIGGNMSPNLPKGVCITVDPQSRIITGYNKPHECKIDMALLARQFDDELNKEK
ncbi:hypothetical protein [uncultured Sulfitobacter sp.]|uniref:hypothetical protein n=1 Tax=uncultured Sulfitobacter sp. TaxID=191468 RepID=UPI00260E1C31|nr:hypothetical protein [uncultured Sulfitobacter sp.]